MLSKNIAYYLDKYNSIISFGMEYKEEYMFTQYLLPDILKNLQVKKEIITLNSWDFNNSVFYVDLDELIFEAELDYNSFNRVKQLNKYIKDLKEFCFKNNNSAIFKKSIYQALLPATITPHNITYISDVVLMIKDNIVTSSKNRFDNVDIINHSLIALMRDKKIDDILED